MKIAIVSMNVKQGKCEENFRYMEKQIKRAKEEQVDMIIFPQNAISGYLLGDQWLEASWCAYVDSFNQRLVELSDDLAIVWGNIKYRNKRRFNAAFFAYQGQTHMRVKKNERHAYMDDGRYFEESEINSAIEYKNYVFALNFHKEVQLADMNINLDAHPYDIDESVTYTGNMIYVNAVGMQNTGKSVVVMQGGCSVHKDRKTLYQAAFFESGYHVVDIEKEQEVEVVQPKLLDALCCGIREFDAQVFGGNIPWIVGLSGGLDSSVTCALLAYALGSERIYGFNMATKHNSDMTKQNAAQEAKALGIHYKEGNIQSFVDASKDMFMNEFGYDTKQSLVNENIQARARGYLLSGFAGILGGIIVNNANKVESALGYCTLYGDSVGAISLIGDLTKVQLFELSKELNAAFGRTIVPTSLLPEIQGDNVVWEMAPSAELKDGQFDPMKWFYHDYLVEHLGKDISVTSFLKQYKDGTIWDSEIGSWMRYYGLDEPHAFLQDFDWFIHTMEKNAFKRYQMPPLLSLHANTFASKLESQMRFDHNMYDSLINDIKNM